MAGILRGWTGKFRVKDAKSRHPFSTDRPADRRGSQRGSLICRRNRRRVPEKLQGSPHDGKAPQRGRDCRSARVRRQNQRGPRSHRMARRSQGAEWRQDPCEPRQQGCPGGIRQRSGHGVMASTVGAGRQGEAPATFLSLLGPERISALTKEELTAWALANGWREVAGHLSLTKPGAPNAPIVRLVLKATVVTLEVRKPAGKWEKVAGGRDARG